MERIQTLDELATDEKASSRKAAALFVAGLLIGVAVLTGVIWLNQPRPTPPAQQATVSMKNIAFNPAILTITKGTTVTWINDDPVFHTVTSNAPGGALDSPNINPSERWSFRFTDDGTFEYHCIPHSALSASAQTWVGMTGRVVVGTGQGGDGGGGTPLDLPHDIYNATTNPLPPGTRSWDFTLVARELNLEVAAGVPFAAWTFNGTLPGPVLRVRQGDQVTIRLVNQGTMNHSIDFHSARIDWATAYRDVPPGQTHTYTFTADYPGVYMYHCGSAPVLAHVANGMYGVMIVEPATDPRPVPDVEYVLVLSELYLSDALNQNRVYVGDIDKMLAPTPTQVVFNGYAFQYHPGLGGQALTARPGERIRVYVLNAGPTIVQSFHVIGAIFDRVYVENNPNNVLEGIQTWTLPSSGGAAFDLVIPARGLYPFVTHNFAYTGLGAIGVIRVE